MRTPLIALGCWELASEQAEPGPFREIQHMFEHRAQPLLPRTEFLLRFIRHGAFALMIVIASLAVGMTGYHVFETLPWIDAFVNASMILGGMGPVAELHSTAGKLFAGVYALYSGLIVLVVAGVLFAPVIHRFLHRFHLDTDSAG
jgi:hypothetical protein